MRELQRHEGHWLTERERNAGRLPDGLEYRLPTDAKWEYGCRGGSKESDCFWWGDELEDGEGRINISEIDFLPRREKPWPLRKDPWSDGFPFVSPVDQYGEKSRNGFGLADMCGGVWELVIDHFDLKGSQRLARRSRIALRGRGKRETSSPLAERK